MQPAPPCSAPACWWQMRASGLLLCWELLLRHVICGVYIFIFPPVYVTLWDSKTPHRPAGERVFWCLEPSPLLRLPSRDGSPSLTLLSLFLSFVFCSTSFQRQRAAFLGAWCPLPAFRSCFVEFSQRSMFFQWICGGESGLPILFLHHLRTAPLCLAFSCVWFLVMSDSLQPHGLQHSLIVCPWDFLGMITGVGSQFLLQGIFLTQGLNQCLLVSSLAQSYPTLLPHGLQHTRPPCPSPTPRAYSNSCLSSQWCHPPSNPLLFPSAPAFNLSQH